MTQPGTTDAAEEPQDKKPKHDQHRHLASHTQGHTTPSKVIDTAAKGAAEMEAELQGIYSQRRRRTLHQNDAEGRPNPTIYTPETQIRVSPTLPPPKQPPEREGNRGPVAGGSREPERLPFRLSLAL